MVRVVLFDDRFFEVYGAQENLLLMTQLSAEAGHDPVFVTTEEGALAQEARRRGLSVEIVPAPPSLRRFERSSLDVGTAGMAQMAVDLLRYNLHLARAVKRLRPDVIISAAVRPTALLMATRFLVRRPLVLYAQNDIPRGALAVTVGLASSRICLIGSGAAATFPSWFRRRFARRFVDLPSGRDLGQFAPRSRTDPTSIIHVVTISSMTERKGVHLLIDAVAKASTNGCDLRLTVVGGTTGPVSEAYLERCRRQAAELGVEATFVGWQDDVVPYLERADVFALASDNEGLPGVLIEAMASGLPCVTTRAGSAGDLVDEAAAGFAVPIGDANALAEGLAVLCRDHELRGAMGSRGRAHVEQGLSLPAFRDRIDALLVDVAGGDD